MPFVQGFLRVRSRDGSGNYPDNTLPGGGSGGEIDNSLPGDQPGIDNTLPLPEPPPGIWPPPSHGRPIVPIGPDNTLPVTPGTIWPSPGRPARPDHSLPGGGGGQVDNTLPSQTFWMIAYCPSLGWKYIAVDPSLEVGHPLPPAAQPK